MTSSIIEHFAHFTSIQGQQRLVYTETGAKALTALCTPAYRTSIASGRWPAGGKSAAEAQLGIIREVGLLGQACEQGKFARSNFIPALTLEEEKAAEVMLELMDYCAGRGIDIGRAVMLKHMWRAAQPRKKQEK